MFKRFCKVFFWVALGIPALAACCMLLLWAFGLLEVGFVGAFKSFVISVIQIVPFADTILLAADAAYFSPESYVALTTGSLVSDFLSAFFLGGVMYLVDGFLTKKRCKDSVKFFAKIIGLIVGALILRFTNVWGELTAAITQYFLVILVIVLVLVLSRIVFIGLRAFSLVGIVKTFLSTLINAIVAVIFGCYLGLVGNLALANPVALAGRVVDVIVVFVISGLAVSTAFVVEKLVGNDLK